MPDATALPRELLKVGDDEFTIVWEDGHASPYTARELRQNCPCAGCRDEWTGRPTLDREAVPADLKLPEARLVGNYAVQFVFSDGHTTGIFSFELLRKLCPCKTCRP